MITKQSEMGVFSVNCTLGYHYGNNSVMYFNKQSSLKFITTNFNLIFNNCKTN